MCAALFLLFLVGAAAAEAADPPEAAADALHQGIEHYRAGDRDGALNALRRFVIRNSDSPLLPQAYLYLARIFVETDRAEEALLYLNKIAADALSPEMRLLKGAALVAAGKGAEGIPLLEALRDDEVAAADRLLRFLSLARGYAGQEPLRALFFLDGALRLPAAPTTELLTKEVRPLLQGLTDNQLEKAGFVFAGSTIGDDALLQQAERAFVRGESRKAQQLAAELGCSSVPSPARAAAASLLERIAAEGKEERSIGVILPLSGRFATFGEQVRRGMELAIEARRAQGVRFIFVDADDVEKSAQAVSALANEERVIAIAGPLTGPAAAAAAVQAQREKVPLLTLSQREGLAGQGDYVFRDSLTPRLQVQVLVQHAVARRKITDFAILFPENKLGREMADLFAREVAARGGRITDRQSYAENVTDFRRQVRLLQRRDPALPEKEEEVAGKPHFQALFIPDHAERIGLIVPQLVFYGLEGVQLFGGSGWNSPELLRLGGKYVEGATFVDGFFPSSRRPAVDDFVRLYSERLDEEPGVLEAQGFDAAGILLTVLGSPGIDSRAALRQAMADLDNYRGVTGTRGFDIGGEAEKSLFLLQVQDGSIVEID